MWTNTAGSRPILFRSWIGLRFAVGAIMIVVLCICQNSGLDLFDSFEQKVF